MKKMVTKQIRRFRFTPEVTLGNALQLLSLAAAVVGLWMNLDKRVSAVEVREGYAIEEQRELKKSLATLVENQAVLARTVDRVSLLIEQHNRNEGGTK